MLLVLVVGAGMIAVGNVGIGAVMLAVVLTCGYTLILRKWILHGRAPRAVWVGFLLGAVLLLAGSVRFTNVYLTWFGTEVVGTVADESTSPGAHGHQYTQCVVLLPDGTRQELAVTGPCPAPRGTGVDVLQMPGSDGLGFFRPVLTSVAGYWWGLAGLLGGLGGLGTTVALTVREAKARRPKPSA
ncbi:hypothetical protein SAMN04489732_13150 [Amycolatopsis saalfeldensis]|uniref:Uncharacterized protein n=1 Tax=Amycolatopsis saalfeldensis TaxID=394193 RepID=A0A1H8YPA0_9PSEU|nr:hypothetical protein SAMN04489732_13150 [Amycolatopsis saalfeldensis]